MQSYSRIAHKMQVYMKFKKSHFKRIKAKDILSNIVNKKNLGLYVIQVQKINVYILNIE